MRRILTACAALAALMALAAVAISGAATSGAHFKSANASVNSSGALVVAWDEADGRCHSHLRMYQRRSEPPEGGQQGDPRRTGEHGRIVPGEKRACPSQSHHRTPLARRLYMSVRSETRAGRRHLQQHSADRHGE